MSGDPTLRKLKIKTGVCKRLVKDLVVYEKEKNMQQEHINNLKQSNGDVYVIKKQEEVLSETISIIPDIKSRLEVALQDLVSLMDEVKEQGQVADSDEWKDAVSVKESTESLFDTPL